MKSLFIKLFIIFIYLISSSSAYSIEVPKIKNLILHKQPKKLENIEFQNINNKLMKLNDFKDKFLIINFWATWCAPCKEEMPSLDLLQSNETLDNLRIFPINVGQDNAEKVSAFFEDLKIKNLNPYFDSQITLAKKFRIRGIPTTILFNKEGEEFARIIGTIDFNDKKFIEWLKSYEKK